MRIRETRKPRPVYLQENSRRAGGRYSRSGNYALTQASEMFAVFRDIRPRLRPEPQTIPLLAALPLVVWLWYRGEL